jgi:hypothetical protein
VSVPVSLEKLRREIDQATSTPYLVTVSADGRPHCVSVAVDWRGDALVTTAGNTTFSNAVTRPLVSLVWPPSEPGGLSLIVDANANRAEDPERALVLVPTSAVLHRSASSGPGSSVGDADCGPIVRP